MSTVKDKIVELVNSIGSRLIEISDMIHENPELGFQEHFASNLLSTELERNGFSVERGVSGLPTAFKAVYTIGKGEPKIAFLAEYDALPKLGHACGHNIIGTAAVGAGIVLSRLAKAENLDCTVIVFGTPAEEGVVDNAGGKVLMLDEISKADVALMIHPADRNSIGYNSLAREAFKIEFYGKAAHAAASPHKGINALEALILTFVSINALRQHLKKDAMIHGIVEHGGDAPNIVPDYTSGRFYARTATIEYLGEVVKKIKRCAEGAALQTGAKMKFTKTANTYANAIPNHTLIEVASKNFRYLGLTPPTIEELKSVKNMGSTDFGNVSQLVPALEINPGIVPIGTPGHSVAFAEAAGSKPGHDGLLLGVKLLALTGFDLLSDPNLISNAKKELKERRERLQEEAKL